MEEESSRDDGSKDYDGPEDTPVDIGVRGVLRWMLCLSTVTSTKISGQSIEEKGQEMHQKLLIMIFEMFLKYLKILIKNILN